MNTFALRKVKAVNARQELDELMIDGKGQLDAFEQLIAETDKRFLTEFKALLSYGVCCERQFTTRYKKDVTFEGTTIKEYEFKSKHLRVYAIKQLNGKIVVSGGFKKNQKADFKRFRTLKEQYLNSL